MNAALIALIFTLLGRIFD